MTRKQNYPLQTVKNPLDSPLQTVKNSLDSPLQTVEKSSRSILIHSSNLYQLSTYSTTEKMKITRLQINLQDFYKNTRCTLSKKKWLPTI